MILVNNTNDKETNSALLALKKDLDYQFFFIENYIHNMEDRTDDVAYLKSLYDRLQKIVTRGNLAIGQIQEIMEKIAEYNRNANQ